MKRFLYTTYWVSFERQGGYKYHTFEKFYLWKTPLFIDWMANIKRKLEKEEMKNVVVINCGII